MSCLACYSREMIGLIVALLMAIAVASFLLGYPMIYGLCFGIVFTYLFTTDYLFKNAMGRFPTDKESGDILKSLFKR